MWCLVAKILLWCWNPLWVCGKEHCLWGKGCVIVAWPVSHSICPTNVQRQLQLSTHCCCGSSWLKACSGQLLSSSGHGVLQPYQSVGVEVCLCHSCSCITADSICLWSLGVLSPTQFHLQRHRFCWQASYRKASFIINVNVIGLVFL